MSTRTSIAAVLTMFCLVACKSPQQSDATVASTTASPPSASACKDAALALQVLGSGGPIPDDGRASTSYLVWQGGKSRALIDVGGGAFVRFGEAGATIADLDVIAISHLHADHVADLPALLKGGYFAARKRKLPIIGPSGNERFPAMDEHLRALFDGEHGAFRYLSGYLSGDDLFPLDVRVIDAASREAKTVYDEGGLKLDAVGVHHGVIPSLGFLLTVGGKRIAFSGDQSADNAAFQAMIAGADVLVVHHALPNEGFERVTHLHRTPAQIGTLAGGAKVGRVVLGHNMQRALRQLDAGLAAIRASYAGAIDVADDLSCYVLSP